MECKKRLLKDTYVAVDIKRKKILSLQVTSEQVHDSNRLKKLVDNASENNDVKRVIADDGAYMIVKRISDTSYLIMVLKPQSR
jgi:hypothetical protein